jgi:hypothetical protein
VSFYSGNPGFRSVAGENSGHVAESGGMLSEVSDGEENYQE